MPGHLDVIAPGLLLGLGAVCVVLWAAVLAARRRSSVGAAAVAVLALAASVLTGAAAVNAHYRYLPRLDDVLGIATWPSGPAPAELTASITAASGRHYPLGAVIQLPIEGRLSGFGTRTAYVYLPPQYFTETTRRFPVAYLLHGAPGAPVDWFRAGDAAQAGYALARSGHPAVLVAPRLSRSWLDDSECVDRQSEHVETYVTRDVVPAVDGTFRTIANRSGRLLLGLSAGGYCALNVGLLHRTEFGALADLSGLDEPTHTGGARGLFGDVPDVAALYRAQDPAYYVPTLATTPTVRVYLASGLSDSGPRRDEQLMATELHGRGEPVTLAISPGAHTYDYWRAALPAGLSWWLHPSSPAS